jgi:hypothetical protein
MKQLDNKGTFPCLQAGTPQNHSPEIRHGGQHAHTGRATIPYIVARLFSCLNAKLFALATILALAVSCVTNVHESYTGIDDGERLVTLALTVPGTPATRALPKNDAWENAVNTVDVLLFDASGNFKYRAIGSTAVDDPAALPKIQKSFTVKRPVCTNHTIVVLANARAALAASTVTVPVATLSSSPTFADVLDNLVQELASPANKWTDEFETSGIPMWGYHDGLTIALDAIPSVPAIALTRSVARVDLQVGEDADDIFSLASAHLYNYNRAGSLAPAVSGTGYNASQWDGSKATAPHLPALASLANQVAPLKVSGTPLSYSIHAGATVVLGKIEYPVHTYNQYIYTFEADAVTAGAQTNTCLVIGGYYNNNPTPTYYRIDFADNNGDCLPLLRNHRYIVTIKEVHAHGYSTKEEAYANKPANIKVEILPWNGGGLGLVVFNDQHYLAVDRDVIDFSLTGGTQHVSAATDFGSWTIEDKPTWISVTPMSFAGGETVTDITVTASSIASGSRNGEFYIVAGNLRKKITVGQQEMLELAVTPAQLVYDSNGEPVGTGTLTVTASIAGLSRDISVAGDIAWISGRSPADFTGTTDNTYAFHPTARATGSGESLASEITITVTDAGRQVTRRVTAIQLPVGKTFFTVMNNPYPAAGGSSNFAIVSASGWQISNDASNPTGVITLTDTGAHAAGTYNYPFTLGASPSYVARELHLTATLDGGPNKETITIVQSGTPLVFNITNPSSGTHDFGSSTTAKAVTLSTNATKWIYTVDGGETLTNMATPTTAPGVSQSGAPGAPSSTYNRTITFTPTSPALPPGTVVTRTLTFSTQVGQTGIPEISKTLVLTRTIPYYVRVTSPGDNSPLATQGGAVTITADVNTTWWAYYTAGSTSRSATINGPVTGSQLQVTIPANTGVARDVVIHYGHTTGSGDTEDGIITLNQAAGYQEWYFFEVDFNPSGEKYTYLSCPPGYTIGTPAVGDYIRGDGYTPVYDEKSGYYFDIPLLYEINYYWNIPPDPNHLTNIFRGYEVRIDTSNDMVLRVIEDVFYEASTPPAKVFVLCRLNE